MPKFVSGSSGHIYGPDKTLKHKDDDDFLQTTIDSNSEITKKPSAINKKGTKEQHKNSLDLFKEELRRLNEERDEQRQRLKQRGSLSNESDKSNLQTSEISLPVPVPLKPDPRCSSSLTLQVNINQKDKDTIGGSYAVTTNIYVGNVNPTVNENDLCDLFGKYGPLASIKVMWPRTDEERARNRNSGFVAFMSRGDAERALKDLQAKDFRGYEMKLGKC